MPKIRLGRCDGVSHLCDVRLGREQFAEIPSISISQLIFTWTSGHWMQAVLPTLNLQSFSKVSIHPQARNFRHGFLSLANKYPLNFTVLFADYQLKHCPLGTLRPQSGIPKALFGYDPLTKVATFCWSKHWPKRAK
jgi:hypothetical protein